MRTENRGTAQTGRAIPRFSVLRVVFVGMLIYQLLYSVVATFAIVKHYPLLAVRAEPERFQEAVRKAEGLSPDEREELFAPFFDPEFAPDGQGQERMGILPVLSILGAVLFIYWFHRPLYKYFGLLRRAEPIPVALRKLSRRRLMYSAAVAGFTLAGVVTIFNIIVFGAAWLNLFGNAAFEQTVMFSTPLSTIVAVLSALFMFSWQKHRVQKHYSQYVLSPAEMQSRPPEGFELRIGQRLWLVSFITVILPLAMSGSILFSSLSFISDPAQLSNDEISILLGRYIDLVDAAGPRSLALSKLRSAVLLHLPALFYIDAVNSVLLIVGIVLASLVALGYSFFLVRLHTVDIVEPIRELQARMQALREGELSGYVNVRSGDEIGQLTIGFNRMVAGLEERDRIKGLFGQYLTREVSEQILNGRVNLSGQRFDATIMFSDIRDFTAMSEKMSPEEVLDFLNTYMGRMIDVIVRYGGIIDKFIGDGILAVFGAPVPGDDHADRCIAAAVEMQAELQSMNRERRKLRKKAIAIGTGVHSGTIIAGNVGNERKLEYTVLGDTVNLASRIEGLTRKYKSSLIISADVAERLSESMRADLRIEPLRKTRVKGKQSSIKLYTVRPQSIKRG